MRLPVGTSHLRKGEVWRRRKDGKLFEVVYYYQGYRDALTGHERPAMVQFRRRGAVNLKNTNWVRLDNLTRLYEES